MTTVWARPLRSIRTTRGERRPASWLVVPLATALAMWGVFHRYADDVRALEARQIGVIGRHLSNRIGQIDRSQVLVTRPDGRFWATVTPSCSSLLLICVLIVVGTGMTRHAPARRVLTLASVIALVAATNIARLTLTVVVAARFGRGPMAWVHDWVGTAITFASCAVAMVLLLTASRPRLRPHGTGPIRPGGS